MLIKNFQKNLKNCYKTFDNCRIMWYNTITKQNDWAVDIAQSNTEGWRNGIAVDC